MSIRIIRNINLNNVKLLARRGNLKFNLLDNDNNLVLTANADRPHNITSFPGALYSAVTDTSGNVDSVLKSFKPRMSIQFIEDNGIYKLFFDRNDIVRSVNSDTTVEPYSRELGVILGNNPAIEEDMCRKLDNLNPDGVTIYSCPSLEFTTSDWKKADNDDDNLLYKIQSFTNEDNFGQYSWFGVKINSEIKDVWVKIESDCSINVLPDNKLIFNDNDEIINSLEDIVFTPYKQSLQDFVKFDLSKPLNQDVTEYLNILEKRINEAIEACESKIQYQNDDKSITLDTLLKHGSVIEDRYQGEKYKLWVLNNMRYVIKDESFIENILLWMLILNSKSTINPVSIVNGRCLAIDRIPTLPRDLIRYNHIVPYLDDINILDYISNFVDMGNIISYNDELDDDAIGYRNLIYDTCRYVCESMIGIKLETLNICLSSAKYLRSKYMTSKPNLDMNQLNALMKKYPDKSIIELSDMYKLKYDCIDKNLDAIDKLIGILSKIINRNTGKSVISLMELQYDGSWNQINTKAFSNRWALLACLNLLVIGDTNKDTMCHEFETSYLRSYWKTDIPHNVSPKTV